MKKAFEQLDTLHLPYEFHDYKKQAIEPEKLTHWLEQVGAEVLLNKRGTTWRKLSPEEQTQALSSTDALITALATHTSMIKRPVLETKTGIIVGFNEAQYQNLS